MHWTYDKKIDAQEDLQQGDILLPTDALRAALNDIHPWFCNSKYLGFIVLTQSCDLVRGRGDPCKAPHIAIAPIRSARQVVRSLLPVLCEQIHGNMYLSESKGKLSGAVAKIINQNESSLGLFYLHPDTKLEIGEESVATLRISVSLKSREHYSKLQGARIGRLKSDFAHKLGWMCGYLYSRVGVEDWQTEMRENDATDLISNLCDFEDVEWISSAKLRKKIKRKEINFVDMDDDKAVALINNTVGREYKEIALEAVERVCLAKNVDADITARIKKQLQNDQDFTNAIKIGNQ